MLAATILRRLLISTNIDQEQSMADADRAVDELEARWSVLQTSATDSELMAAWERFDNAHENQLNRIEKVLAHNQALRDLNQIAKDLGLNGLTAKREFPMEAHQAKVRTTMEAAVLHLDGELLLRLSMSRQRIQTEVQKSRGLRRGTKMKATLALTKAHAQHHVNLLSTYQSFIRTTRNYRVPPI